MRFVRHFIILVASLGFLFLAGHVLPKLLGVSPSSLVPEFAQNPAADSLAPLDTLSFSDGLKQAIPVLKTIKGRGKGPTKKPDVWMLGNGISIPNYMLRAQRYILENKGQVIRMDELHGKMPSGMLTCADSSGNAFTVELRVGESFLDSASRIGVAFTIDSLTIPMLNSLNNLDFTITLLVTPFDSSKALFAMLDQLKRKELVAWIPMESYNLLNTKLGSRSIQIHHSESDIESTIEEAFRRMPEATGVATRLGQRAVEHKPLLDALLKPLAKRKAWFWDLTANRFSRTQEACEEIGISCRRSTPYNPDITTPELYIAQALNLARKSGKAALALPLTEQTLDAMAHFKENAAAQGTEIVNMSAIIDEGD